MCSFHAHRDKRLPRRFHSYRGGRGAVRWRWWAATPEYQLPQRLLLTAAEIFSFGSLSKQIRKVTPTGMISTAVDESTVQSPQGVSVMRPANCYRRRQLFGKPQSSISVPRI
jgi:hypothetical protein